MRYQICEGTNVESVLATFLISVIICTELYQKALVILNPKVEKISKLFIVIQIMIGSGLVFLSFVFLMSQANTVQILINCAGLMFLNNIDNIICALMDLQLMKDYPHVFKHERFLQTENTQV